MRPYLFSPIHNNNAKYEFNYLNDIRANTSTHDLILSGNLVVAVQIPKPVHQRYITEGTDHTHFTQTVSKMSGQTHPNRFKALIVFSMNDSEAANNHSQILKVVTQPSNS